MRDDNTEPRDNQQMADDSEQSEIDLTRKEAEEISGWAPEEEPHSPYQVRPTGNRARDEPLD